ncbi:hypothetical protein SMY51_001348 [Cronobacter sakazakii]|uniref:hypothetical protein n=1 Tax=Cronobacter sakazakii TaxID=28141 RepID=UPI000CFD93CF|nr:hypothetical protein [Cronobacter sakazakii]ELY4037182.1 hypothetical protein [Cronobacter sakazakii]ELY4140050.1 hypothetical protein [Cronobacter sakazakii]ELY4517031.1 hypothetical protein [Cronobacter sakazakii]ELY5834431.1 hypothetical protein [Cronobacter sakazakii]HDK7227439.1 hypothetical protein [Cronobacter sakazakii]
MIAFWHEYSELITSFLAALLGGFFTMRGVIFQVKQQAKQQAKAAREKRITTLMGIREEIDSLIKLYLARMAEEIEKYDRNSPFDNIFPITQNYFTFYEANSSSLAEVQRDTLSKIVAFYTSARSLIDSYRGNNALIERLDSTKVASDVTGNKEHLAHLERYTNIATNYGRGLMTIHEDVMLRYKQVIDAINDEISQLQCG